MEKPKEIDHGQRAEARQKLRGEDKVEYYARKGLGLGPNFFVVGAGLLMLGCL